jgi:hypothetical protein
LCHNIGYANCHKYRILRSRTATWNFWVTRIKWTCGWTSVWLCGRAFFLQEIPLRSRSQWPRGLRHEMSSPAWTLGSWVRFTLEEWMFVCVYAVFVLSCVGSGLATGWSLVQGVLPIVYKCKITEPHKEEAKVWYGLERHKKNIIKGNVYLGMLELFTFKQIKDTESKKGAAAVLQQGGTPSHSVMRLNMIWMLDFLIDGLEEVADNVAFKSPELTHWNFYFVRQYLRNIETPRYVTLAIEFVLL